MRSYGAGFFQLAFIWSSSQLIQLSASRRLGMCTGNATGRSVSKPDSKSAG